ncbi:MAG: hypothetical protein Q7S03_02360 [bacterium]|nr:hypothetical protein [bacterium]
MTEGISEIPKGLDVQAIIDECEMQGVKINWTSNLGLQTTTPVEMTGTEANIRQLMVNVIFACDANSSGRAIAESVMRRNGGVIPKDKIGPIQVLRELIRVIGRDNGEANFFVRGRAGKSRYMRVLGQSPNHDSQVTIICTGGGDTAENYCTEDTFRAIESGLQKLRTNPIKFG